MNTTVDVNDEIQFSRKTKREQSKNMSVVGIKSSKIKNELVIDREEKRRGWLGCGKA